MATATAVSGLARCLILQGDIDGSIERYIEAWQLFQEDDDLRKELRGYGVGFELIQTYFANGELNRAFGLLLEIRNQVSSDSVLLQSLIDCAFLEGWLYYQLEDYQQCERCCRQAMDLAENRYGDRDAKFGWPCGYVAMSLEARGQPPGSHRASIDVCFP